jgi:mRNA interferase RelE/StbE
VTYNIELSRGAYKSLKSIPQSDVRKIRDKIEKLKNDPLPHGSEKLEGSNDLYRIRSGDYRVIYQVVRKRLFVLVVKIGHRREIYRC